MLLLLLLLLFWSVFLSDNSGVHPLLGEIARSTVSSQVYAYRRVGIQAQRYRLLRQLHSDFGDFNHGVCHVLEFAVAESNPDIVHFILAPTVWLKPTENQ